MVHPETKKIIPIPMHKGKDVSVGLIREIINEIGISREEWIKARNDMWRNSKNKNYCSSL